MTRNYQAGGLAQVVDDPEETLAGSTYRNQDEIRKDAMQPSTALRRLQEARQRLIDQREPQKGGKYLAMAEAFLAPTRTGGFSESLGKAAGALGDYTTGEQKRLTDIDKELLDTEVALEQIAAGYGRSSAQREFEALIAGFTPEEQREARRVRAGIKPRAVGSSAMTIAEEDLTDMVADSQALIRERTKFGEMTGSSRAKTIDKSYETMTSITANMLNLDRAIQALEGGASTGFVQKFFPSIRESSITLDQIQKRLGLDIVGATTFGALSKGELDLALATALPTSLEPPELIEFLQDRKAAQGKLLQHYRNQIDFLDQGGTVNGFIRKMEREAGEAEGPGVSAGPGSSRDDPLIPQPGDAKPPKGTYVKLPDGRITRAK